MEEDFRPNPDELLESIIKDEINKGKGKLKIFFGMCAGVGKTYAMLKIAHQKKSEGVDIVIGYIETHKRVETEQLVEGLELIPRKKISYKGSGFEDMDLDAVIHRKPQIVLVDELAHTNIPESRHRKRYQDVLEILDNGIDVYTTLNVQHLESRAETVNEITGITVRETLPDSVLENADEIELIDSTPDELLKRLSEGKVYFPEKAVFAAENFFRKGNLHALREMSLRITAERVDMDMLDYMRAKRIMATWKTTEKLMVAVGPSPSSAKLIRWTRRMAYNLGAQWIAVSIDLGNTISETSRDLLTKNQDLAKELGAKIIHIIDNDIVSGLLRIAKQNNVTQIVIGKTNEHPFNNFLKGGSIVDRLLKNSENIDVYVVKADKDGKPKSRFGVSPVFTSKLHEYIIALTTILIVSAIFFPLKHFVGYQTVGLFFLLTIATLSLFVGRLPVFLTAFFSVFIYNFFFITPLFTFHINNIQDIIMLCANFIIALITGTLINRIRKSQKVLQRSQNNISTMYSLLNSLNNTTSIKQVVEKTRIGLQKFFEADAVIYLKEKEKTKLHKHAFGNNNLTNEKEFSVASWVFDNKKEAGKFTNTLPGSDLQYHPLMAPHGVVGVIGINYHSKYKLGNDNDMLLKSFISQISSSLDREINIDAAKEKEIYKKSQSFFQTILDSVSHELRTPIATIIGSADMLTTQKSIVNEENKIKLINEISIAAFRLNRLVDNLLNMQRVESGMLKAKLDWCDLNELVNIVLNRLKSELYDHQVIVEISKGFPLIKIDSGLVEQVLFNLVYNAIVNTPPNSEIRMNASFRINLATIVIADNGEGFPAEDLGKVFTKYYQSGRQKTGGIGLGLSIAKGFIEAHNGEIKVENQPGSGAKFTITLPVESFVPQDSIDYNDLMIK